MGYDVAVLFDVSHEGVNLEWLLEKLTANPPAIAELVEHYREQWLQKTWEIKTLSKPDRPALYGPGGFVLRLEPRTLILHHMMRFGIFTGDASSRSALRRACVFIADLVGSSRAIYTHELMPHDGQELDQIEAGLRARIGPPATTFEQLHAADYWGPRAWYIDTFAEEPLSGPVES